MIDDSIGLVKGAPHPEAARRFIDWVGSEAAQQLAARDAFRLPARTDLLPAELPAWAQGVLRELVPAAVDWSLLDRHGQEWMATWDREVRGKGAQVAPPNQGAQVAPPNQGARATAADQAPAGS